MILVRMRGPETNCIEVQCFKYITITPSFRGRVHFRGVRVLLLEYDYCVAGKILLAIRSTQTNLQGA